MMRLLVSLLLCLPLPTSAQARVAGYVFDETTRKPIAGARAYVLALESVRADSGYRSRPVLRKRKWTTVAEKFYYTDSSFTCVKTTVTDSSGAFVLDSLPARVSKVRAFFRTGGDGIRSWGESAESPVFLLAPGCDEQVAVALAVHCRYDETKDLLHCPKCGKKDKVRIQVYGLYVGPLGEPGMLEDDGVHYHNGYCVVERCHPTKFCLRCREDF